MKTTFTKALKISVPVMAGYIFLGSAFGVLVQRAELNIMVAITMSVIIYAGSMQFAAVELLVHPISLFQTFILTLSINARHLFYGISMINPFKEARHKQYMIFGLTDESYSLIINHQDDPDLMFWIELINQIYWVIGSVLGYIFGAIMPFDTTGIEFSMTALFLVIFMDKLKDKQYKPQLCGLLVSIVALVLVGKQHFIFPSMVGIMAILFMMEAKA
jgi:4-azaleucine resistance transporter AzlC